MNTMLDMLSPTLLATPYCAVAADINVLGKLAKELRSKLYSSKEQIKIKNLTDLLQPFKGAAQTL